MHFLRPEPGTVIVHTPTVKYGITELAPDGGWALHNHPASDEVYLFMSGECEIVAPGAEQVERFTAPMQAYIPAGTSYSLKSVGTQPLKVVWTLAPSETPEMRKLPAPTEQVPVVMLGTKDGERFPDSKKIRGGMLTFQPNIECDYHSHDGADEVFLFLSGTGDVTEEGEVFRVGPGDVVVTPAEHKHKIKSFDEPLVMWLTVTPNRVPSHTHYRQLDDGTWERITPR